MIKSYEKSYSSNVDDVIPVVLDGGGGFLGFWGERKSIRLLHLIWMFFINLLPSAYWLKHENGR